MFFAGLAMGWSGGRDGPGRFGSLRDMGWGNRGETDASGGSRPSVVERPRLMAGLV
jgi:hypothetical protein